MANNPFWDRANRNLVGEHVVAKTGDRSIEGTLSKLNYSDQSALLRWATETTADGETIKHDTIIVNFESIGLREDGSFGKFRLVNLDNVRPSPFSVRKFDSTDFYEFVRMVRKEKKVRKLPVVREIDQETESLPGELAMDSNAEFEIVSGHRRLAALKEVGLQAHNFIVIPVDQWQAATRFVDEHFPLTDSEQQAALNGGDGGWYSPEQMRAAYARLCLVFDEESVNRLPAIDVNAATIAAEEQHVDAVAEMLLDKQDSTDPTKQDTDSDEIDGDEVRVVATELAEERDVDVDEAEADVRLLHEEYNVPLGAAKGSLRRKYE